MTINRLRSKFVKTTREVTVYREQEEGYAEDDLKMGAGSVFHVANQTETKTLHCRRVEAVLFTIGGGGGWFGMPKTEFVRSTEAHNVKTQTGTPFQP